MRKVAPVNFARRRPNLDGIFERWRGNRFAARVIGPLGPGPSHAGVGFDMRGERVERTRLRRRASPTCSSATTARTPGAAVIPAGIEFKRHSNGI